MQPTKYKNLYKTDGLFQYVYVEDNSKIEARNWNDLKFKLAIDGIKLQEKTDYEKNNTIENHLPLSRKRYNEKTVEKQVKPPARKRRSDKKEYKKEPLKKNRDYIESEDDVSFGKIVRPGEIER